MTDDTAPILHGGFLAKCGATLIENGYQIVPISGGEKVPRLKDWTNIKSTKEELKKWLSPRSGFLETGGTGVLAKHTPAIDVDIRDKEVADQVEAFIREHLGDAPMRVGQKPKRLFVFRTDTPFTKITSKKFIDSFDGSKHQVEILGDGQQFVAYHIHPDTGRPYFWEHKKGLADIKREDLINITHDEALSVVRFFEQIAGQKEGWTEVRGSGRIGKSSGATDDDRMFSNMLKTDVALPDMARMLMEIPDNRGYDFWTSIGQALHYEYDASEDALEVWCEWSAGNLDYDHDETCAKWETFGKNKNIDFLTGAFILGNYRDEINARAEALIPKLIANFHEANSTAMWSEAAAEVAVAEISYMKRQEIVGIAKKKLDKLTDSAIPLAQVRKELAYKPVKREGLPSWLEGWVYDTENDMYYHLVHKTAMTKQAFSAQYDREALTKEDILNGKSAPTFEANDLALKIFKIPTVHGRRYGPGELTIYSDDGVIRANTYPEYQIPKIPDIMTPGDRRSVKIIKRHIAHLLENPAEQRMLLDWLSYVVQNPGERINYVCFIQGVQGDGKSFFASMLAAVMGRDNVNPMSASILDVNFNGWSVGQCVLCIEEVRLVGEKRYEVMNKMKDPITNPYIGVTFKGKETRRFKNTTSYMMYSNYMDALPIDDSERRYLILFSRWQSALKLRAFMDENPNYYLELYNAIEHHPGAIRQFLLEHEQDESFNPKGHAPRTPAFEMMRQKALPSFVQQVIEACEDEYCDGVSFDLLNMQVLGSYFRENDFAWPTGKAAANMLTMHGWTDLGRIKFDGFPVHFYTRKPDMFRAVGGNFNEFDSSKIRKFADDQLNDL